MKCNELDRLNHKQNLLAIMVKLIFSSDAVMMGVTTTLNEDTEPSIPPGFGPFATLPLWGIHNDAKPAVTHSTPVQALQSIRKDSEECQPSAAVSRSDTPCSTSGTQTCRKSLRNRPPIDYSRFEHISDEDSDVEIVEKVGTHESRHSFVNIYLTFIHDVNACHGIALFFGHRM